MYIYVNPYDGIVLRIGSCDCKAKSQDLSPTDKLDTQEKLMV